MHFLMTDVEMAARTVVTSCDAPGSCSFPPKEPTTLMLDRFSTFNCGQWINLLKMSQVCSERASQAWCRSGGSGRTRRSIGGDWGVVFPLPGKHGNFARIAAPSGDHQCPDLAPDL